MRRRRFLIGATACALGAPRLHAQGRKFRIGVLNGVAAASSEAAGRMDAFAQDLEAFGWKVGHDVEFTPRWFAGDLALMRQHVAELVDLAPDVIVSVSDPALAELRRRTSKIPVVFLVVADPVGNGFVDSLARPGGNLTGISNAEPTLAGKWIELLREVAPDVRSVVTLLHPESLSAISFGGALKAAAASAGLPIRLAEIRTPADIEAAIAAAAASTQVGLIILPSAITSWLGPLIASRAAERRLPAIYPFTQHVAQGGLISYGIDITGVWRQAPWYVDRILRGASPGDLPVQQPSKFELAVNLGAARALRLAVPAHLIGRADQVFE